MKQDKGHGVVILDQTKYIEKFYSIINTNQFLKLDIARSHKNPR